MIRTATSPEDFAAYGRLPDGTCEMKRLYVHDRCRGQGVGRRLCAALLEAARTDAPPSAASTA